jgi:hypothetical protein
MSAWTNDGSLPDIHDAMWIAYSVNKEDIWVSRIPLPICADPAAGAVADHFDADAIGPRVPDWNTYSPKWAPVGIATSSTGGYGHVLRLEDRDPYDYARADRVFAESKHVVVDCTLVAHPTADAPLAIELSAAFGDVRPVRLTLSADGHFRSESATDSSIPPIDAPYTIGQPIHLTIDADTTAGMWTLSLDGKPVGSKQQFAQPAETLSRLTFRTGTYRALPGTPTVDVAEGSDKPIDAATVEIAEVSIK